MNFIELLIYAAAEPLASLEGRDRVALRAAAWWVREVGTALLYTNARGQS